MKAYKIELLVVDYEDYGKDEIVRILESQRNIYPTAMKVVEADIGEWSDDHPLNKLDTMKAEYDRVFGEKSA